MGLGGKGVQLPDILCTPPPSYFGRKDGETLSFTRYFYDLPSWPSHCVLKQGFTWTFPTFGSFSLFQASILLRVDKVLQKLTKSQMSSDIYFKLTSWFLGNVRIKPHFNAQCPAPSYFQTLLRLWSIWAKVSKKCWVKGHYCLLRKYINLDVIKDANPIWFSRLLAACWIVGPVDLFQILWEFAL